MKGLFWFLDFPPTPPAAKILPILSLLLSPKEAEGDMGGVGERSVEKACLCVGGTPWPLLPGFMGVPAGEDAWRSRSEHPAVHSKEQIHTGKEWNKLVSA